MSKTRPIVPVNFDNDGELLEYINGKGNRAEFIRYCIRKEMMEERKNIANEKDLDIRIEKILRRCLADYQSVRVEVKHEASKEDNDLLEAASFFDED